MHITAPQWQLCKKTAVLDRLKTTDHYHNMFAGQPKKLYKVVQAQGSQEAFYRMSFFELISVPSVLRDSNGLGQEKAT